MATRVTLGDMVESVKALKKCNDDLGNAVVELEQARADLAKQAVDVDYVRDAAGGVEVETALRDDALREVRRMALALQPTDSLVERLLRNLPEDDGVAYGMAELRKRLPMTEDEIMWLAKQGAADGKVNLVPSTGSGTSYTGAGFSLTKRERDHRRMARIEREQNEACDLQA